MTDPERLGETSGTGPPLSVLLEEFGQSAYTLYMDLEPIDRPLPFSPGQQPHWTDTDRQAFGSYLDIAFSVYFLTRTYVGVDREPVPAEPLTSDEAQRWLQKHIERDRQLEQRFPQLALIHDGLPFTDEERAWIWAKRESDWDITDSDEEAAVQDMRQRAHPEERKKWTPVDFQIITLGDRHGMIDGRDFVRRWAAWRRGADEYTDRRSFNQAREALLSLGEQLLPEGPDMEAYQAVQSRGSY